MPVLLTVSKTAAGSEVSDVLSGGSSGLDYGQVVAGAYAPITSQSLNTGWQDIFIRHDAVTDPITDVKFYVEQYTGTYGGANTASADISALLAYGAADSGSNKNNADGASRGLHIDMDWQVSSTNAFDYTREGSGQKRIFGKSYSGNNGSSLATGFALHVDACSYWNGSTEADATTPQTGKIGKSTDTVLGNRAHILSRFYLHSASTDSGVLQWATTISYSFTI